MKARVIRDDIQLLAAPDQLSREWMEITDIKPILQNGRMIPRAFWKVGAIIDMPDCWRAVAHGWAEPADDECAEAAGHMTREQLDAAQKAYTRINLGIHPEDYAAFDAGEILGYNPDGSYKPGPNWVEPVEDDDEEDDE